MFGRQPIHLDAPSDSVLARAINALARFPLEHSWVLIGGIAVFLRLGTITRPTADAETIARSQAELLAGLAEDQAIVIVGGDVTFQCPADPSRSTSWTSPTDRCRPSAPSPWRNRC